MGMPCGKRSLTITWAILECIFFSGILNGWVWLEHVLKQDAYFTDQCNISRSEPNSNLDSGMVSLKGGEPNSNGPKMKCTWVKIRRPVNYKPIVSTPRLSTAVGAALPVIEPVVEPLHENFTDIVCEEQDAQLELMLSLVIIIRNILMLPFGIFLDKFGTSRTRLVSIILLAFGALMVLFCTSGFPWLLLPALTLLSVSGFLIIWTDAQIANLFGDRRYTVMSAFVGSYLSGGLVVFLMKLSYEEGLSLQTSFMFITIGVVPVLISTIVMLPKSRIPWPLPADYGKGKHSGGNKDEVYTKSRAWKRRISAGAKCRRDTQPWRPALCNSLYIGCVTWFCALQLKSFVFDVNVNHLLRGLENDTETVKEYSSLYAKVLLLSFPVSPLIGLLIDTCRPPVRDANTAQMLNISRVLWLSIIVSVCSSVTSLIPVLHLQIFTFVLHMLLKVTVLAALFAFLTHGNFPSEHFGKCVGLAFAACGVVFCLQFPLKALLTLRADHSPIYMNIILLGLDLLAVAHPVNVLYQCRRGLLNDTSSPDLPRKSVTIKLMDTKHDPEEARALEPSSTVQSDVTLTTGLQVTDL